ncbi:MAG: glycosyltransferase family 39 protein [Bacteroidetes bacterium]|nr:glycosyltransferase family 39 protein [Bacteroidota bacterium]
MKEFIRKFPLSNKYEYYLLSIIILVGGFIRFWNYGDMPFMHDELSALSRLQFDNIFDVIKYGVMLGDTHPAGVQIFLYYWIKLGGTSEIWVKLPFILSGILSIWLVYKIGKLWFSSAVGLFASAMISTTQFFVMYSQIARPYSSGLLITLIMVLFWSLYFFEKRSYRYLIPYVLFSALAAYNHHFSLLFAAIVGFSGVIFIKSKKDLLQYGLAGVIIFILYLPHLKIFLHQLSEGGIGGWLSKPEWSFVFDYFNYMVHFSILNWIVLIIIIIVVVSMRGNSFLIKDSILKRALLIIWFILPVTIGYLYSVLRNPIIQYSMLIFSTPYIYIYIFSFQKRIKPIIISILIIVLMSVNIYVLVNERKHYMVFYKQPYQELFNTSIVTNSDKDVHIIDDCIPYFHDYYFDKYNGTVDYFTKRNNNISLLEFSSYVDSIKNDVVITHALTGSELQIVQNKFPYHLGVQNGFTYDINIFSRKMPMDSNVIVKDTIASTNFENNYGNWQYKSSVVKHDTVYGYYVELDSTTVWGPSITFDLEEILRNKYDVLDIAAEFRVPEFDSKTLLVGSVYRDNKAMFWNASNSAEFNLKNDSVKNVFLTIDMRLALKNIKSLEGIKLKIFVWNKSKSLVDINNITITSRPGNMFKYGLYNRLQ